ncbi:DUF3987 domain-containing protein [Microcoleus sp. w1-18aA5]|uniref:DUF3987 domain-containing protein n=1 Tax=Microcoleus sp. w1-18aA5 TaxID=2818982 RepID=UPI002FCE6AEA
MVANFSKKSGSLIPVTKANPCPHCGKPDWCYSIGELSVCKREQPPATGWEATSKADKDGHVYYARPQEKKAIRPRGTRYWVYNDRNGSPLIRVVRFDDGKGGKNGKGDADWTQQSWGKCKNTREMGWIGGTEGVERENIPVYRYAEVREAIANNELIFIAEGEDNVDRLWALGFAATCNLGGSGKWRTSDTNDLQGAKVVIIPDRDEPGIKHAELLHQEFPDALWLYPYPNSKAWENLPKSKGLDMADWIEQHQITAEDIKGAIGEKKVFKTPTPQAASNVVPLFPEISELGGDIDALIEANLRKSELTLKVATLSEKYRQSPAIIWKIYQEKEEELQQQNNQDSIASELAQLLASKSVKINLLEIFPQGLAEGITRLAKTLNIKAECYALALLTQVSALLKPGTSTMLYPQTNFKVCPNYFGATIGESSQKKTPIKVAVISEPMEQLIDAGIQSFEAAKIAYEEEFNLWKKNTEADKGLMPKPPAQRIYHITTATGESIPKQAARMPDQSLLWVADELAGTFKSANQYRGGKGSDEEDLLEYWSGGGAAVLRAEGLTVNARRIGLSIFGNIQPKVLAQFLKDGNDDNGKFARFDFVQQPLAATELFEDAPNVNISPMLADLYKRLDPLPAQKFKLDKEARKAFIAYNNQCERERINHPKQGMRAMLGKAPEKVGKVATILHCIDSAFRCVEVSESIPVEIVQAAIKWVTYTTSQALSVNLEICDATALAPNLDKIISLAKKKGGTVSARDAQNSFDHKLKIKSQQVKEWFAQLEAMKYGKVTTVKKSVLFTLATDNDATVVNCSQTVDKEKLQLESLHHKGLIPTVVTVVSDYPPSGKSNNQLLDSQNQSPTTPTVTTVVSNVEPERIEVDYSTPKPLTTVTTASTEPETVPPASLIAPPEPETAPTAPTVPTVAPIADELPSPTIIKNIREAIANIDQAAAKITWQKIKNSATQKEAVKADLEPDENLNFRLLLNTGWLKGTQVRYTGTKFAEQYAGIELTVEDLRDRNGITCRKPDGSYTADMDKEDLEKLEQPEVVGDVE